VRVLDGDQPGHAVLLFDRQVESQTLRLAFKHIGQGAYLWPEGSLQRSPYFFDAERVQTPRGVGFQVGPEVVNHLLEDDHIEAASEDGLLTESGFWGAVTPSLSMIRREGSPSILVSGPAHVAAPPAPAAPLPAFQSTVQREVREAPAPPPAPPTPKAPEPQSKPIEKSGPSRRSALPILPLAAVGALALAALAALAFSPGLRCSLLGVSCAPKGDTDPSVAAAEKAFACAAAGPACAVEGCFADYLRSFPDAPRAGEARSRAAQAKAECFSSPAPKPIPPFPVPPPQPPAATLADGVYRASASAVAGCGVASDFPHVSVCGGVVTWKHQAQGASWQWRGSIRSNGEISAAVAGGAGYEATGNLVGGGGEIKMSYPGCRAPVTLKITGQLSSGCEQKR
jgi:hypothetical protein